jgi:hypothetical protein
MRPALLVFLYGLAVAWYVPALLTRLTARGISVRLGLMACRPRSELGARRNAQFAEDAGQVWPAPRPGQAGVSRPSSCGRSTMANRTDESLQP